MIFSKLRSLIFKLDPEVAHDLAIKSLKLKILPKKKNKFTKFNFNSNFWKNN